MTLSRLVIAAVFSTVVGQSASAIEPAAPDRLVTKEQSVTYRVLARLRAASVSELTLKEDRDAVSSFYADRGDRPLWVSANGLTKPGRDVIAEIGRADDYGLRASDFDVPNSNEIQGANATIDELVNAEFRISTAVLRYARHARGGRIDPRSLSGYMDVGPQLLPPADVLAGVAVSNDAASYLRALHPQHPQFEALRQKLLALRTPLDTTPEVRVPDGPILRPGMEHENVVLLRQRLLGEGQGDASATPDTDVTFDDELEDAVRTFQKEAGLTPDGIVGPSTLAALNGRRKGGSDPEQILMNMERWRWLPADLGEMHVVVNVPEQLVRVYKNGKAILTDRVVVGKLKNQTPIFSADMTHLVFHPFWNVPNSIKVDEILPYLRKGNGWFNWGGRPQVLKAHNLYVKLNGREIDASKVNWNNVDIRRYHFYQPPGGKNVLGFVKFMFPNKHAVYLHDTTEKHLFSRPSRIYSHGCVRVQHPRRLAEVILGEMNGWSTGRVGSAIGSGSNNRVNLDGNIPVHIAYFTAWVNEAGALRTAGDIYGHDARLRGALRRSATERYSGEQRLSSEQTTSSTARRQRTAQRQKTTPKKKKKKKDLGWAREVTSSSQR